MQIKPRNRFRRSQHNRQLQLCVPLVLLIGASYHSGSLLKWPVGTRTPFAGDTLAAVLQRTGRPARMDSYDNAAGALAARIRADLEPADEAHHTDSNLAVVRERIAELEGSARLRIVTLAALAGCSPDQLPAMTRSPLPAISNGLPDDVKIDLIARRADLTASRWRVEAAQKDRESARAEFFPDVSINALIGLQSVDLGNLLQYNSRVPAATAAIHLPIFDGGRLKARYGASQAALDTAIAGYQDTLVGAARDVATQVTSRAQIAAQRTQRLIEVQAAENLKSSAAARVRQGVTDSRAELAATESWIEQRDELLLLDSAALSSDIGLQRALGGGYQRIEKP